MQLGNLKFGVRLGIGFGLIVLLMLIASTHSVQRISGLNGSIDLIITSRYPRIVAIAELQNKLNDQALVLRNAVISINPMGVDKWRAKVEEDSNQINGIFEKLKARLPTQRESASRIGCGKTRRQYSSQSPPDQTDQGRKYRGYGSLFVRRFSKAATGVL